MSGVWLEAMVRASWQGGLLVLGLGAALFIYRRATPEVRARLWLLAISKFALALFLIVEVPVLQPVPATSRMTGPAASSSGLANNWPQWLLILWAAGLAVTLLRVVGGGLWLRRLVREAVGAGDELRELWRATTGLEKVEVRLHPEAPMPLVAGLWRPVILLPEGLAFDLSREEMAMVFAHEAAHLRRRDPLTSLYVFACFAVFSFHPLVWLAKREWQHHREAACDAEAIQVLNVDRKRYAQMLIKVSAAGAGAPILALSAAPSFHSLHRRIIDMKHANHKNRGGVLWTPLAAVMAMAAVPIALVPRQAGLDAAKLGSTLPTSSSTISNPPPASSASVMPVAQTAQNQKWTEIGGGVRVPANRLRRITEAEAKRLLPGGERLKRPISGSLQQSLGGSIGASNALKGPGWSEAKKTLDSDQTASVSRSTLSTSLNDSYSQSKSLLNGSIGSSASLSGELSSSKAFEKSIELAPDLRDRKNPFRTDPALPGVKIVDRKEEEADPGIKGEGSQER